MPETVHGKAVPLRQRFHGVVHGLQKIIAVRLNVESDQVRAQQAVHQFPLPRANPEHFRVRPRNVPENRHARVRPRFLHHSRQQGEVIVLREKNRRFRALHFLQHHVRESPVNSLVLNPILGTENRPRVRDVAQRPEPSFENPS